MDPKHKTILRENYIELSNQLKTQVAQVCNHLYSKSVLTDDLKDEVLQAYNTDKKRADALLSLLPSRGPNAFEELYNAVLLCELKGAANILKPEKGDHWRNDEAVGAASINYVENPVQADTIFPDDWNNRKVVNVTDTHMKNLFKEAQTGKAIYKLQNGRRGRAVIINNKNFDKFSTREGTSIDKNDIKELMEQLSFEVVVHKDLKNEDIMKKLSNELGQVKDSDECFILIILSHGLDGLVFGTDGDIQKGTPKNATKIIDVRELVCKQKQLIGKPKLFFIQACRGAEKDPGVETDQINMKEAKDADRMLTLSVDSDGIIPTQADCFVALATIAGYVAYRNRKQGTWFIQTVTYVLSNFAHKCDIQELMTKVNNCIAEKGNPYKQISEVHHTLRKKFYFFPGLAV